MPKYTCECFDCENREAIYWVLNGPVEGNDRVYHALEYQMLRHDTAAELGWMMICQVCLQFWYEGGFLNSENPDGYSGLEASDEGHEWWKRPIQDEIPLSDSEEDSEEEE